MAKEVQEIERIFERVGEFTDLFRHELSEQAAQGHEDRFLVFGAIAKEVLRDHDENPWEYEQLLALWVGALFLLAESREEVEQLRNALPFEGNRRAGPLGT